ncbi:APC family permease [Pseudodesulfovibrio sediminis]|uniref:Amino acid permease n=1 Tax=Pseudodesulfovibrio sediminis TaxID=2810563 RepID=A0ABM7P469_9BACT|nr:amino acid permease [Pseudodesulfovibrio sediminis]BCS87657.1 amino acid permease [Pseudodesulfovibrio sediminis]
MSKNTMGALQLSGLIVGAVLGSGIVLLPPIAQAQLGTWAIMGWVIILSLGAVFAGVFAKLALAFPGSEGVPIAVREAFGPRAGQLVSNYIICAVLCGPVAVLMTAADTIARTFNWPFESLPLISGGLLCVCAILLMRRVTVIGTVSLLASIGIGVVLLAGSVTTIALSPEVPWPDSRLDLSIMGRTLLVLFWAIIGWEIIGNYSMEVRDPKRSVPQATALGVSAICIIYFLVAWALYCGGHTGEAVSVADVVRPLLGSASKAVIMVITVVLCLCTFIMIIGGISRLIATLAGVGKLPGVLAYKTASGAPVAALGTLFSVHLINMVLLYFQYITLEQLLAFANVFFLANSLVAILAAMYLFPSIFFRISCAFLCSGFVLLLVFSSLWPLLMVAGVTVFTCIRAGHKSVNPVTERH